jgi:hypothetical protein
VLNLKGGSVFFGRKTFGAVPNVINIKIHIKCRWIATFTEESNVTTAIGNNCVNPLPSNALREIPLTFFCKAALNSFFEDGVHILVLGKLYKRFNTVGEGNFGGHPMRARGFSSHCSSLIIDHVLLKCVIHRQQTFLSQKCFQRTVKDEIKDLQSISHVWWQIEQQNASLLEMVDDQFRQMTSAIIPNNGTSATVKSCPWSHYSITPLYEARAVHPCIELASYNCSASLKQIISKQNKSKPYSAQRVKQ